MVLKGNILVISHVKGVEIIKILPSKKYGKNTSISSVIDAVNHVTFMQKNSLQNLTFSYCKI
jgi:hypothetical protein